jgi:hypothetical protein
LRQIATAPKGLRAPWQEGVGGAARRRHAGRATQGLTPRAPALTASATARARQAETLFEQRRRLASARRVRLEFCEAKGLFSGELLVCDALAALVLARSVTAPAKEAAEAGARPDAAGDESGKDKSGDRGGALLRAGRCGRALRLRLAANCGSSSCSTLRFCALPAAAHRGYASSKSVLRARARAAACLWRRGERQRGRQRQCLSAGGAPPAAVAAHERRRPRCGAAATTAR